MSNVITRATSRPCSCSCSCPWTKCAMVRNTVAVLDQGKGCLSRLWGEMQTPALLVTKENTPHPPLVIVGMRNDGLCYQVLIISCMPCTTRSVEDKRTRRNHGSPCWLPPRIAPLIGHYRGPIRLAQPAPTKPSLRTRLAFNRLGFDFLEQKTRLREDQRRCHDVTLSTGTRTHEAGVAIANARIQGTGPCHGSLQI